MEQTLSRDRASLKIAALGAFFKTTEVTAGVFTMACTDRSVFKMLKTLCSRETSSNLLAIPAGEYSKSSNTTFLDICNAARVNGTIPLGFKRAKEVPTLNPSLDRPIDPPLTDGDYVIVVK